ncbi:hypothetical protein [Lentzea terrae]|uniref:hypothetical protein n=1 Tax=Lentzea terrae TaxID=2200761 RepID=UPI000DD4A708|nr:hypothetical protein [Lentzea terrae]
MTQTADQPKTATCLQQDAERAWDLDPWWWLLASEEMTLTRRAAHGVVAVTAFLVWTPDRAEQSPAEAMLTLYRHLVGYLDGDEYGEEFGDVLADLLADLWHLASAYGIELGDIPAPFPSLAMDLHTVLLGFREAARGPWVDAIDAMGRSPEEIESEAYQIFLADRVDGAMMV